MGLIVYKKGTHTFYGNAHWMAPFFEEMHIRHA